MTMTVRQMIEWMSTFEDQDAIVEVVVHSEGSDYYSQGGNAETMEFDPQRHVEYTDMRGNQFVNESAPYYNRRSVVFGVFNG
jgi:phosphoribosylformylglycinamidine (FGAM) synthase-like amidotransferase family enzyme